MFLLRATVKSASSAECAQMVCDARGRGMLFWQLTYFYSWVDTRPSDLLPSSRSKFIVLILPYFVMTVLGHSFLPCRYFTLDARQPSVFLPPQSRAEFVTCKQHRKNRKKEKMHRRLPNQTSRLRSPSLVLEPVHHEQRPNHLSPFLQLRVLWMLRSGTPSLVGISPCSSAGGYLLWNFHPDPRTYLNR